MKKKNGTTESKRAVLDLNGARCASCAYTIEHLGRKVQGVRDIRVITDKGEVHVEYEGSSSSLERIVEIVKRIGYSASIRWESIARN
ncbi:MAG: cation transporter [Spirochaetes bacterium]|jgi:copper chaperone CopZ|nr:cation transporter [Spirochaetota bacterium]